MKRMMSETIDMESIELPSELLERIEQRVAYTEFDSMEEYVAYAMEEVLHHVETVSENREMETVNEEEVQERLKSLGYLNE